jgi:hypothetical protein
MHVCLLACLPVFVSNHSSSSQWATVEEEEDSLKRERALANSRREYKTSGIAAGSDHQLLRT